LKLSNINGVYQQKHQVSAMNDNYSWSRVPSKPEEQYDMPLATTSLQFRRKYPGNVDNVLELTKKVKQLVEDATKPMLDQTCNNKQKNLMHCLVSNTTGAFHLTRLNFSNLQMTDSTLSSFVQALVKANLISSIIVLDISYNKISQQGIAIIVNSFTGSALKSLNVSGNCIYKQGAIQIASALATSLVSLAMDMVDLDDEGGRDFFHQIAASQHMAIQHLSLSANSVSKMTVDALCLCKNLFANLTSLDLSLNALNDDCVDTLANIIEQVPSLIVLNVSSNETRISQIRQDTINKINTVLEEHINHCVF